MSEKEITLIMAYGPDGVLGKDGGLPWPSHAEDMRRFRRATLGNSVVMGRKTFESLGKPLPWRQNVVITSQPDRVKAEGDVVTAPDIRQALLIATSPHPYVIGGASVYRIALPYAHRILLTEMKNSYPGDIYYKIPFIAEWEEISREPWDRPGEECDFVEYKRKP